MGNQNPPQRGSHNHIDSVLFEKPPQRCPNEPCTNRMLQELSALDVAVAMVERRKLKVSLEKGSAFLEELFNLLGVH
jgi:hypothetical protein